MQKLLTEWRKYLAVQEAAMLRTKCMTASQAQLAMDKAPAGSGLIYTVCSDEQIQADQEITKQRQAGPTGSKCPAGQIQTPEGDCTIAGVTGAHFVKKGVWSKASCPACRYALGTNKGGQEVATIIDQQGNKRDYAAGTKQYRDVAKAMAGLKKQRSKKRAPPSGGWHVRRISTVNPWGAYGNQSWWKIHDPYYDNPPEKVKQRIKAGKDFIWNKSEKP